MSIPLLTVSAISGAAGAAAPDAETAAAYCRALESGSILFLPQTPLALEASEREVLRRHDSLAASHKNIAYDLGADRMIGVGQRAAAAGDAMRRVMRAYAQQVTALLASLLVPYAGAWRVDYTSFRPREEEGRVLPQQERNDLLHVDAFPSRPTNGDRILRVFTNMHPTRARCWVTTDPFDVLIQRFVERPDSALALPRGRSTWQSLRRGLRHYVPALGGPLLRRTPYDAFMLRFHDRLKADAEFQSTTPKYRWEFPPGSSWILFTDFVPHAALSGQFALEQTYMVPRGALLQPERAPISILERLCGISLSDPGSDR
jgi:hypothetical protein